MGVAGSNRQNPRSRASGASRASGPSRASGSSRSPVHSSRRQTPAGLNGHSSSKPVPLVFTIPSELSASRDVQKQIMRRVEDYHYGQQSTFAINLALEEGLANAIKHGNRRDPGKSVRIEAKITPELAEIVIEDQGKGFARKDVPDPCCDENLLKCSGRGILLMEAYMDKVKYSQGGRRVRMIKKNIN